ncbi:MAG: hypothetical protein ACYS8K_03375 [Planctomycetota bacterium]
MHGAGIISARGVRRRPEVRGICNLWGWTMGGSSFWMVLVIPGMLVVALGVVFAIFRGSAKPAAQRARRMRGLAERLGLRYYGAAPEGGQAHLPPCGLFERAARKTILNLLSEESRPPRFLLFDCRLRPLRGPYPGSTEEVLYLVAMVRMSADPLVCPLKVCRTDWFGPPIGVGGLYGVELEADPDFSRQFRLAGEPREQVRQLLTRPVREVLKSWTARGPKPLVEIWPGWTTVYVESEPHERGVARRAAELLDYAARIARVLSGRDVAPHSLMSSAGPL